MYSLEMEHLTSEVNKYDRTEVNFSSRKYFLLST